MRTAVSPLQWIEPTSVDDAVDHMARDPELVPVAGCTDLYVALQFGHPAGTRFLNLWSLEELRGIEPLDGGVRIGALTTYTELIRSPLVRERLPMLVAAAREVGGAQIQNRGTLGGNIANASPAGDTLPVLAAADATIVLRSSGDTRRAPMATFYTGYRATVRRPDELIAAIELPAQAGAQWFRKVGTRAAQAISKVVMAGVRAPTPRVAIGSVGPTVMRLPRTEACLAGGGSIDDARTLLAEEIHPIDDLRSTRAYRLRVAQNLLARFWSDTA